MTTPPKLPTVSVVIGAYNAERWIGAAVESVLAQTHRADEIIVVDDGSTDATRAEVERFGDAVHTLHQGNAGSGAARNTGVRAARSRYVAFLDADDLWHPEKLAAQLALHRANPDLAWSYTDTEFFDSDTGALVYRVGDVYPLREGGIARDLLLGNFITVPSVVIEREAFWASGGFREGADARISEDWDLWLRVAARHRVRCVREPLTRARQHTDRKTETMDLDRALADRLGHIERAVARDPEGLGDVRDEAVAHLLVGVARKRLNREERGEARRLLARALRLHPSLAEAWGFYAASLVPRPALEALGRVRQAVRRGRGRGR